MRKEHSEGNTPTQSLYRAIFNEPPKCDIDASSFDDLLELLNTLTRREEDVIKRRFGIGVSPETQKAIGDSYGIGGTRIGQIEHKALRKLRHPHRAERIKKLFATRAELRAEIEELKQQLREAEDRAEHTDAGLLKVTRQFNVMAESIKAEKIEVENDFQGASIVELDFSVRTYNNLARAGIKTVGDLIERTRDDLARVRNFGARSIAEVEQKLADIGTALSTD